MIEEELKKAGYTRKDKSELVWHSPNGLVDFIGEDEAYAHLQGQQLLELLARSQLTFETAHSLLATAAAMTLVGFPSEHFEAALLQGVSPENVMRIMYLVQVWLAKE